MSNQQQKDPWSGKDKQTPPDLIELIQKIFNKKPKNSGDGNQPTAPASEGKALGVIAIFGIILVMVIWFISGFFIVSTTDQAPILRFGKYIRTEGPGLHWIPRLFESAYPVNVQSITSMNVSADMLTQDENLVTVEIAVQYRINNPKDYLFNVVQPVSSLQQVVSSAMRQVIGDTTLDSILTTGRQKVRDNIEQVLIKTLEQYHSGIQITDVNLQPAKPPAAVTAAFDDAINAREDKQKFINKAEAYQNKVLSMVKGQEARITQDAQAYKGKVTEEAQGKVSRYLGLLKPYQQNPTIMENKMYFDAVTSVLNHTNNVINTTNGKTMLYLPSTTASDSAGGSTATAKPAASDSAHMMLPTTANTTDAATSTSFTDPYAVGQRPSYSTQGGQS